MSGAFISRTPGDSGGWSWFQAGLSGVKPETEREVAK